MKAHTALTHTECCHQISSFHVHIPAMVISARDILALLSAVTVAAAIIAFSVWFAGMDVQGVLGASTWGTAFVFFALAMDSSKLTAFFQLVTGISLLGLAWLQYIAAPDYAIVSGALVAIWLAVPVFRRLR